MRRDLLVKLVMALAAWSATASAGIPEPDYILHGQVCIGGKPASAQDDVTIIARATVDAQVREVGRYKMGENPAASDCHGEDDCYVLRIRLESVPPGETASGSAVVLAPANPSTAQVFLIQGNGPEQLATEMRVSRAGVIRRLELRDAPATADLDGDGDKDLADYQVFRLSFQGPAVVPTASCTSADLNGDGHVDLRDFAIVQETFTGPTP